MINNKGFTLIELLVTLAIITIIAAIGIPEISEFVARYKVRSASTNLLQNLKLAKAMSIKENRDYLVIFDPPTNRYLIGHDGDGDGDLITVGSDTFGVCKDTNGDKLPDADSDSDGDGVPDCVKMIDVGVDNEGVVIGYGPNATPAVGPDGSAIPASGVTFGADNLTFEPDGTVNKIGSVYFQHANRAFTWCVRVSNFSAQSSLWLWIGDKDNPNPSDPNLSTDTTKQWREVQ